MITARVAAMLVMAALLVPPLFAADSPLLSKAIVIEKERDNRIDVVKTYLAPRARDGQVKIWVFFTDKNVFTEDQFARAAGQVTVRDRTLARRANVGMNRITFADLPVVRGYVDDLIGRGGKLRRISRWLNAASFEIPLGTVDQINGLPFVAKVRPVAAFTRADATSDPDSDPLLPIYEGPNHSALDYGTSYAQLNQINVPTVHSQGFNGSGVIVAMLDTGYKKDHEAFTDIVNSGRLLAEYDFIFNDSETDNEAVDVVSQHDHGTYTWSTLGGSRSGQLYGPAYGASFVLAKTEDMRSETPVEEDNWAAAVEWADSLGAQVISSSLGYSDWYTYADFDGQTAVVTIAANLATAYGIIVCNSMGNEGPNAGTLTAPADAFEILSCGAVNSTGSIASFSSRGPTYDGRMKPEVCARGVSTYCAGTSSTTSYAYVGGTSLSTPLIGGCAAVLLSARPSLTPQMVRLALMMTANRASNPDNTYGWGIADLADALDWGAKIGADIKTGSVPLTINFIDSSYVPVAGWTWSFGDSDSSLQQNPVHVYDEVGVYDVTLRIISDGRPLTATMPKYIIALADTLTFTSDTVYAGRAAVIDVNLTNSQPLQVFTIPFDFSVGMNMTLDSFTTAGTRAAGFATVRVAGTPSDEQQAIYFSGTSPIPAGSGPIMKLFFRTDPYTIGNSKAQIDTVTVSGYSLKLSASEFDYIPVAYGGEVVIRDVARGDANNDGLVNVGDAVSMINFVFKGGAEPITIESGDANSDFVANVADAVYVINFIFRGGPPPDDP